MFIIINIGVQKLFLFILVILDFFISAFQAGSCAKVIFQQESTTNQIAQTIMSFTKLFNGAFIFLKLFVFFLIILFFFLANLIEYLNDGCLCFYSSLFCFLFTCRLKYSRIIKVSSKFNDIDAIFKVYIYIVQVSRNGVLNKIAICLHRIFRKL